MRHSVFVAPSGFRASPSDRWRPSGLGARPTSARPISAPFGFRPPDWGNLFPVFEVPACNGTIF